MRRTDIARKSEDYTKRYRQPRVVQVGGETLVPLMRRDISEDDLNHVLMSLSVDIIGVRSRNWRDRKRQAPSS